VIYRLHPDAAFEHKQQVVYYEAQQPGLGQRYHADFRATLALACEMPLRPRVIYQPNIRSVSFKVFRFSIFYREAEGLVQILAIASHRRQPGYWLARMSS
jgi:toxin ParE1/3/4